LTTHRNDPAYDDCEEGCKDEYYSGMAPMTIALENCLRDTFKVKESETIMVAGSTVTNKLQNGRARTILKLGTGQSELRTDHSFDDTEISFRGPTGVYGKVSTQVSLYRMHCNRKHCCLVWVYGALYSIPCNHHERRRCVCSGEMSSLEAVLCFLE